MEEGQVRRIKSVLFVDDDEQLLRAYARRGRAYRVFTATSTDEACVIAAREPIDLAVVDLRLGDASGIDAIRKIRSCRSEIIVVLCSAYNSIRACVHAMRAGAWDVFAKPIGITEMIETVERGESDLWVANETRSLALIEREYMERVIDECGGSLSEAANRLGISRTKLRRRLRLPATPW